MVDMVDELAEASLPGRATRARRAARTPVKAEALLNPAPHRPHIHKLQAGARPEEQSQGHVTLGEDFMLIERSKQANLTGKAKLLRKRYADAKAASKK